MNLMSQIFSSIIQNEKTIEFEEGERQCEHADKFDTLAVSLAFT